jgi:hypothetical protein
LYKIVSLKEITFTAAERVRGWVFHSCQVQLPFEDQWDKAAGGLSRVSWLIDCRCLLKIL